MEAGSDYLLIIKVWPFGYVPVGRSLPTFSHHAAALAVTHLTKMYNSFFQSIVMVIKSDCSSASNHKMPRKSKIIPAFQVASSHGYGDKLP